MLDGSMVAMMDMTKVSLRIMEIMKELDTRSTTMSDTTELLELIFMVKYTARYIMTYTEITPMNLNTKMAATKLYEQMDNLTKEIMYVGMGGRIIMDIKTRNLAYKILCVMALGGPACVALWLFTRITFFLTIGVIFLMCLNFWFAKNAYDKIKEEEHNNHD